MTSTQTTELSRGKSVGELGWEAVRFLVHTCTALLIVAGIMFGGMEMHLDPNAANPKIAAAVLAAVLAFVVGLIVAKAQRDSVARYVWVAGLLLFAIMCVWVLDLPTGNGLCEHCGAVEKLTRTFFSIDNGSGLAGGWGLVLGAWAPLALICYALGAQLGLDRETGTR